MTVNRLRPKLDVHVLEIVLARTADLDAARRGRTLHRAVGGAGRIPNRAQRVGRRVRIEEGAARVRGCVAGNLRWSARAHHPAARLAALGPKIDDPVGCANDVQIVLDHQQRMPGVDQAPEGAQQLRHVVKVQAGGGLVEQKKRAARCAAARCEAARGLAHRILGQMPGQLEALRLAARQRRHRLTQAQIVEADLGERRQDACTPPCRRRRMRAPR